MTIVLQGLQDPGIIGNADYAALRVSVALWLNRTDLDAVIPDFVRLAEAEIKRDIHWIELEPLLAADSSNDILANAFDVYLFKCCEKGAVYLRDAEGAAGYRALYDEAVARLNMADFGGAQGDLVIAPPADRVV